MSALATIPASRLGRRHLPGCRARRGTVLVATMWILVVLTGMVLTLSGAMRIEAACSANYLARQQAAAVESGAVQYVLAHLEGLAGQVPSATDMPCQAVPVGDGAFWVIRADRANGARETYGLVDEASKANLNTASGEMLALLPEMTPDVAAAILDWRDADGELSVGGAESEYYLLLPRPYECKNAPFETVEELLLVKQVDAALLFGEDANRSGWLDPNEDDGDDTDPPDNRDGRLDAGIHSLVTVYSYEMNVSASGGERVNVNQASNRQLSDVLGESLSGDRLRDVLNRTRLGRPFQNVLDFYFRTGMTMEEFEPLADRLTTVAQQRLPGLINVNTAPPTVLKCLPGLEEADAAALVEARSGRDAATGSIAWVVGALPQAKAVGVASSITVRSHQFSADIVSVAGNGRAFRRCRIVVDAAGGRAKLVYRQDLTDLGWPLDEEILLQLRSGEPLEAVLGATAQETR